MSNPQSPGPAGQAIIVPGVLRHPVASFFVVFASFAVFGR